MAKHSIQNRIGSENFDELAHQLQTGELAEGLIMLEARQQLIAHARITEPDKLRNACKMLSEALTQSHRIAIDADHVPDATGQALRTPFPMVSLSHQVTVHSKVGEQPVDTQCIDILIEVPDKSEVIAVPFFKNIRITDRWMPGLYTATYNYEDYDAPIMVEFFWGFDKHRDTDAMPFKEPALATLGFVRDVLQLINCTNVSLEVQHPSNLRKMRAKKKGIELNDYHTIRLPSRVYKKGDHAGGTHASPAMHHRRGHYRTIHAGTDKQRDVYVHPCVVGAIDDGRVVHDYKV